MAKKAPGKHFRKGISLIEITEMFPDDKTAEQHFIESRWPNGVRCPYCEGDRVAPRNHPTMPYHCGDCRKFFSAKTGTVMQGSNIGYRKWLIAIYLMTTGIKGTSSMKLHRDIGVTQKTAWHMAHRIRKAWDTKQDPFSGEIEVDETHVGGKLQNMHPQQRKEARTQPNYGKAIVVGAKERKGNRVAAKVVESRDALSLQGFVYDNVEGGSSVYTDDHPSYKGLYFVKHDSVNHSVKEYVRDRIHTQGVESFWSLLKRGYVGTYHRMSFKHLPRYVDEFTGRHNDRPSDTIDQISNIAKGMVGKRLRYKDLIGEDDG